MTRLDIVKRLCREANGSAGPHSTTNQSGEYLRFVEWADNAYNEIQLACSRWDFLIKDFTAALTLGDNTYSPVDLGRTDHATWITEDWRMYIGSTADEQFIDYLPWEEFRIAYMYGTSRTQTGRPTIYTVKPDESIMFYPVPDAAYTVVGQYYAKPDVMTLDAHGPIFPDRFHMAVVWKALESYGQYSAEYDKNDYGRQNYDSLMVKMKNAHGPKPYWGAPLA